MSTNDGKLLYRPSQEAASASNIQQYMNWLATTRGLSHSNYEALWTWSTESPDEFWRSLWDYFEVLGDGDPSIALAADSSMPGARWFPDTRVNFAEHALRRRDDHLAIIYTSEAHTEDTHNDGALAEASDARPRQAIASGPETLTYAELYRQVMNTRRGLMKLGVECGDRVVSLLPNCPEAVIAFLATASLGAIWSSCAPEFGVGAILDRFQQIEPKILFAVDGYAYGGKQIDRRALIAELRSKLPTLEMTIMLSRMRDGCADAASARREGDRDKAHAPREISFSTLSSPTFSSSTCEFDETFTRVPFDHPLWVLYSSGTTGLPKAIVHGHGGILLELQKSLAFHLDLKPEDRFFWFTTTGWMMWNFLIGGLTLGTTLVLYEGSPAHPSLDRLWAMAEAQGVTYFGTSAPFLLACAKAGIEPSAKHDLTAIRGVGSTGAPLPAEGFEWVYEHVHANLLLGSVSGGTDVCTAFVGSCPLLPVHAGEIQCRALGASVHAFDAHGTPVLDEVGELVLTTPMPSMPVFFWNDPDGARLKDSYFSRFSEVWCHGDWIKITPRGTCVIYGRSDATLNRGGVRMGTSEFYRVVEALPEIQDALVVDTSTLGNEGRLWLFLALKPGHTLDENLRKALSRTLRDRISPRHVPDEICAVPSIPRTLSGKKVEIPVRKILLGSSIAEAISQDALADPASLDLLLRAAGVSVR